MSYDTPENFYVENAMALLGTETRQSFSRLVGIDPSYLCKICKQKRKFSAPMFLRLLELTGKRPSEMFLELAMPPDYFERDKK